MAVFVIGPALYSLYLSFTDTSLDLETSWVGTANYQEMFTDDYRFWTSLRVTATYLVLSVPLYLVFGFAGALLLNMRLWGIRFFRTILFLPSVLSGVAVSVLWLQLLNSTGPVNSILRAVGIAHPPLWFSDPDWAVPGMVVAGLWGVLGSGAIIWLSGLQNIPEVLYEAARIDGAGWWRRLGSVTLPLLTPTVLFILLTSIIGAFQMFDTAFVFGGSRGGTSDSLLFYLLYLWQTGFREGRLGYAAALSWVLFAIGVVVVLALLKTQNRWVYYENEGQG
jgi:multiple sugar transport system permease protein